MAESRVETILQAIIDKDEGALPSPLSRVEELLIELKAAIEQGSVDPELAKKVEEIEQKISGITNVFQLKGRVANPSLLPTTDVKAGYVYLVGLSTDAKLDEYVYTIDNKWEKLGSIDATDTVGRKTDEGGEVFNSGVKAAQGAHAEGVGTQASGANSHAEGSGTTASGHSAHTEGAGTRATDVNAHAEGSGTTASGTSAHAEGGGSQATNTESHAEGHNTKAEGMYSHAGGNQSTASHTGSFAHGDNCVTSGEYHFVVGRYNTTFNYAGVNSLFTVGGGTASNKKDTMFNVFDDGSFYAQGIGRFRPAGNRINTADDAEVHNRARSTNIGSSAFAEGNATEARGSYSHAEGFGSKANGKSSHAEGDYTYTSGEGSHAEGSESRATGDYSHSEGDLSEAEGYASHAEGVETSASGRGSHSGGQYTIADQDSQTAIGKYNASTENAAFIIGNGSNNNNRSNALSVDWDGKLYQNNSTVGVIAHNIYSMSESEYAELTEYEPGALYLTYEDEEAIESQDLNEETN